MCPVTGGALLAASLVSSGTIVAGGFAAAAVSAIGAAAIGAAIGVGIGGVINVATGRGFFDGAGKAALFGAIGGAFSSGVTSAANSVGEAAITNSVANAGLGAQGLAGAGQSATTLGLANGTALQLATEVATTASSTTNFVVSTGLSGLASALTPKPFEGYGPQASQQDFSGGQIRTTGSGGSKAAVSLAEAVTRTKQRKLSQADVSSLSVDTSSFASGGLQFA